MERTTDSRKKEPIDGEKRLGVHDMKTFSEVVSRYLLAAKMGMQYENNRDLYQALGYPQKIGYSDYFLRYTRQDIAKAVIDRPVKATWSGPLELIESNEAKDTEFEKAWKDLDRKLGIKTLLSRLDRLTGIGRYGVLLLGLDDVSNSEGFKNPIIEGGVQELKYIKPFGEQTAVIDTYETDPKNERYGKPLLYSIKIVDLESQRNQLVKIHYSRIIHVTDDNLESDVLGIPRLEAVFNRLMDIEKIVGGDGEMFWRGARPGFHGKVDPDYTMTEDTKTDLLNQLDEYEHNLRRFLINEGVDIENLAQQVADPSNHVDVQIQMISAVTGIPKRILTGSERGELASTQDTGEWLAYIQARREDHAEPRIVRPFVDRLLELNLLPNPAEDYTVVWQDLFSVSEKARVEIGKSRANALREYTSNPIAEAIMPPDAFLEKCMGFTTDEITMIREMRDEQMGEEVMDIIKDVLDKETAPEPPPMTPVARPKPKPAVR